MNGLTSQSIRELHLSQATFLRSRQPHAQLPSMYMKQVSFCVDKLVCPNAAVPQSEFLVCCASSRLHLMHDIMHVLCFMLAHLHFLAILRP